MDGDKWAVLLTQNLFAFAYLNWEKNPDSSFGKGKITKRVTISGLEFLLLLLLRTICPWANTCANLPLFCMWVATTAWPPMSGVGLCPGTKPRTLKWSVPNLTTRPRGLALKASSLNKPALRLKGQSSGHNSMQRHPNSHWCVGIWELSGRHCNPNTPHQSPTNQILLFESQLFGSNLQLILGQITCFSVL